MMVVLSTGVEITYGKNGRIKTCRSPYDNAVTNKPLDGSTSTVRSSYVPLMRDNINNFFNKFNPFNN